MNDLFVYDKKRNNIDWSRNYESWFIDAGWKWKYDLIANEIALIYKCKVKVIPYMMMSKACEIPQEIRDAIGIHPKVEA